MTSYPLRLVTLVAAGLLAVTPAAGADGSAWVALRGTDSHVRLTVL